MLLPLATDVAFCAPYRIYQEPYVSIYSFTRTSGGLEASGVYHDRYDKAVSQFHSKGFVFRYNKRTKTWKGSLASKQVGKKRLQDDTVELGEYSYSHHGDALIKSKRNRVLEIYTLPLLSPSTIWGYRPLHHGKAWEMEPGFFSYALTSFFKEGGRIWFGISFYEGEGGEGVGGIGFFEPHSESFGILRVAPWNECSAEILYHDHRRMFISTTYDTEGYSVPCSGAFLWERELGQLYSLPFPREREHQKQPTSYDLFSMTKEHDGYWFGASGGIIHTDLNFTTYTYWKPQIIKGTLQLVLKEKREMRLRPLLWLPIGEKIVQHMKETVRSEKVRRKQEFAATRPEIDELTITKPGSFDLGDIHVTASGAREGFSSLSILPGDSYLEHNGSALPDPRRLSLHLYPTLAGKIIFIDDRDRLLPFQPGEAIRIKEGFWHMEELCIKDHKIVRVPLRNLEGAHEVPVFQKVSLSSVRRTLKRPRSRSNHP